MSYARQTALAGLVLVGFALAVRSQEPPPGPKGDDTTQTKPETRPDVPSKSSRSRDQRPSRPPGYRTGNDATDPADASKESKTGEGTNQAGQNREPLPPDARVIQFNFATQPWEGVFDWIAELSGLSLQKEVKPNGTFNYINDPKKYTLGEAMDILNDQLGLQGFTMIRKGNYLKVVSLKEITPDLIPRIKPEEIDQRGMSEFVTVSLPLKNVNAKAVSEEVKGLISEYGKLNPQETTNRLMITDLVANIRLVRDYLAEIDELGAGLQASYRRFQLKFASATKVEATLREHLGLPPRQTSSQSGQRSSSSDRDRGGDPRDFIRRMMESGGGGGFPGGFMQFGGAPGGDSSRGGPGGDPRSSDRGGDRGSESRDRGSQSSSQSNITLAVDEAHNQIFVKAPPNILAQVESVIKDMDVPRPGEDQFKPREPEIPIIVPYRLSDGDAQSLATALNTIYLNTPGVRISADVGNNMVIVTATPSDQEHIKKLVDQFEHDERDSVVLPLSVLDAGAVETLLTTVYASDQRDWRGNRVARPGQPKVVADRTRNQLMIRGSKKQVDDIRGMLAALGETTMTQFTGNEKLRVIPLNSANAQAIQSLLEQYSRQALPNKNPITIIDMNRRSDGRSTVPGGTENQEPAGEMRRPSDRRGTAAPEESPQPSQDRPRSEPDRRNRTSRDSRPAVKLVSYLVPASDAGTTDEAPAKSSGQERTGSQAQADAPPVVVTFGPDNVVIASEDSEAVRMLTNIIGTMARGSGNSGARYTVFDLKTADVTQIQQTLSDLLGISSVSSFFGSSSSQQTSTLKLVPDTRTNSLIVYGNSTDVERVRVLLEVLDRDSPGSGAISAPRIIPVLYANATSVSRVIRDVYASRIASGQGSSGGFGGPPGSPFGQFGGGFPGGSSSSRSSRSATGTLAVGVDEQSNSIVVSCSEAMFQEVKKLVETLDVAANNTERTVQIVTVKNSTPSAVQDALNGLMGISTSSRSRSSSSDSSRGSSGFPSFGGSPMGIQFGGFPGGGGPSPFGGSSFFGRGGFDSGRGGFDSGRGGFDSGRGGFDSGRGGFDSGRGGFPFGGGDFGRDRRP